MTSKERRELTNWRRCALCGKYMSLKENMKDVSITMVSSFELSEPALAHEKCANIYNGENKSQVTTLI